MATYSKREARQAAAGRHARRGEDCPCGRTVYGNGRITHFRTCADYLQANGWPFTTEEARTVLADARASLDEGLSTAERAEAIGRYMRDAAMTEARRRGLIP